MRRVINVPGKPTLNELAFFVPIPLTPERMKRLYDFTII